MKFLQTIVATLAICLQALGVLGAPSCFACSHHVDAAEHSEFGNHGHHSHDHSERPCDIPDESSENDLPCDCTCHLIAGASPVEPLAAPQTSSDYLSGSIRLRSLKFVKGRPLDPLHKLAQEPPQRELTVSQSERLAVGSVYRI